MHSMMLIQNDTIQQDSDNNDKEDNDETKVDKLINETTNIKNDSERKQNSF